MLSISSTSKDEFIPLIKRRPLKKLSTQDLIQLESEIGRTLFGSVEKGHRREFFNFNATTWIWHEEWRKPDGKVEQFTTKYEVRPEGVIKIQPGPRTAHVTGDELENFRVAVELYHERVMREVYGKTPRPVNHTASDSPNSKKVV